MILITIISGLTCFLMACGLYFLFPKTENIRLMISNEQAYSLLLGEAVTLSYKNLDQKAQKSIQEALDKRLEQLKKEK
ncbi:MAG: hypothetical protein HEEMFOPI_01693 [Holosporales bacterium]